jgi:DNA ligase-1
MPYNERQVRVCERLIDLGPKHAFIRYVEPTRLETWEGLEEYEDMVLAQGFEGVITRSPSGLYKFGRSSKTDQAMMKLKRFTDGEAEITGFVELMRNTNPDVKDNFGHAKRSKAKEGMVPGGTLGVMLARDIVTKVEFEIGMFKGLTSEDKQEIWDNQEKYLGKLAKYQHFSHGAVDKPRHSKFLGWRDPADM